MPNYFISSQIGKQVVFKVDFYLIGIFKLKFLLKNKLK